MAPHTHFDDIATEYEQAIPAHVNDHYLRKRIGLINKNLQSGSVLDVGCGTGVLLTELSADGYTVFGVDFSLGMLKIAYSRNAGVYAQASSNALPFKSSAFDAVISIASFHHLVDPGLVKNTIREMVRVTKTNGLVLIWDHNATNPYWNILMRRVPQDKGGEVRIVSRKEIIDNIKACGIPAAAIRVFFLGFVPDFAPSWLLPVFCFLERVVEAIPLLRLIAAHNVFLIRKEQ